MIMSDKNYKLKFQRKFVKIIAQIHTSRSGRTEHKGGIIALQYKKICQASINNVSENTNKGNINPYNPKYGWILQNIIRQKSNITTTYMD